MGQFPVSAVCGTPTTGPVRQWPVDAPNGGVTSACIRVCGTGRARRNIIVWNMTVTDGID
jgi:hypothetical protein